jgi:glycosyltransferase involved in cell wall biosynthesis
MLPNDIMVLSKKMRIVYLTPGCGVSGGIAVICQHANRLAKRGHHVTIVSEVSDSTTIDWFPGLIVPIVSVREYPANTEILVSTAWSTAYTAVLLPARSKFYFVQSDETRFHSKNSSWEHITRLSYNIGYNFLTEARWIKKWLKEYFKQDAELVPNGLDQEIFFPDKPLQPKGKKIRILLEGAIGLPYKGMAEAFKAVRNLDVEVWCVSSYGVPEKHWKCDRFFEQVPMKDMRRIYSSCDILLKLSRVEGFFGPPMEMMACGGAVVVGRVTGYDEYIEDEINALVVDAFNPEKATKAIRRLISDQQLRFRLIENGKLTAQKWQWEKSIDTLERYYLDVLDKKRGQEMSVGQTMNAQSLYHFYDKLRNRKDLFEESIYRVEESSEVPPLNEKVKCFKKRNIRRVSLTDTNTSNLTKIKKAVHRYKSYAKNLNPFICRALQNPRRGIAMLKKALFIIYRFGWRQLFVVLNSIPTQKN